MEGGGVREGQAEIADAVSGQDNRGRDESIGGRERMP